MLIHLENNIQSRDIREKRKRYSEQKIQSYIFDWEIVKDEVLLVRRGRVIIEKERKKPVLLENISEDAPTVLVSEISFSYEYSNLKSILSAETIRL